MPHIHAITRPGASDCLSRVKTTLREIVSESFGYPLESVAFIPRVLSEHESFLSENMLPIEFVIDIGTQEHLELTDRHAALLCEAIVERCKCLRTVNFGVWIREMAHNGFSEHTPQ